MSSLKSLSHMFGPKTFKYAVGRQLMQLLIQFQSQGLLGSNNME